ncbi:MAG: GTPase ObgE [Clostridiales bacterium]|nr:GTPase ObgE [Clostridiales bacterium]
MFIDYVKIYIKSGNGGNGSLSFHREKYVQAGGPDGGNGGNGGDIVLVADQDMRTLLDFHFQKHFSAGNGENGMSNLRTGKKGEDIVIRVPRGTVVKDAQSGLVIADMFDKDARKVILKGGRGGKGNAHFKSAKIRTPNFAQNGEITKQRQIVLELKTIADAGFVGFPNVGKSTILSIISKARPKIANYHFTTLEPNLGVVKCDDSTFVAADIPGLIEGAAEGAGLGHAFLRHIERTRVIVHVVDISGCEGRDPIEDYKIINKELYDYSPVLAELPQFVVANKSELPGSEENLKRLQEYLGDIPVFKVSAATRNGFAPLLRAISQKLKELPEPEPIEETGDLVYYEDPNKFDVIKLNAEVFVVEGNLIDGLLRKVNFDDPTSLDYFQRMLREKGVIDALREKGAKDGCVIRIEEMEFDFVD